MSTYPTPTASPNGNPENYTLSYSESVKGWPGFFTFYPDFMIGMNQYLYTFKDGALYRHNTNETRNNYYGEQFNSQITGVVNASPLQVKLFKTLELESDSQWTASLVSDLQVGNIDAEYFQEKEGSYFAFIRADEEVDFKMRSVNGLGVAQSVQTNGTTSVVSFSRDVGSIPSVGDLVFRGTTTPERIGTITNISGLQITIDTTTFSAPVTNNFLISVKDPIAESHGVRGYYMEFTLENTDTTATELFAVSSDIFKSYP
jgi:hypothetical protein